MLYVLEISSYQLELTNNTNFYSAVLLNITPDHLSRHGGMSGYIAAKNKIFLDDNTAAVVGIDDVYCNEIFNFLKTNSRSVIPISGNIIPEDGIGWSDNKMFFRNKYILDAVNHLDGHHNRQNIAAAFSVLQNLNISSDFFESALNTFAGLEHRQEMLIHSEITFVNDSKATNADAAEQAILRFINADIIWIVGGVAKEGGIIALKKYFPKIREAFLFGASSDEFADTIDNSISYEKVLTLDNAIAKSFIACKKYKNPVVLFSPACASFDQFKNFEERGDIYKKLVDNILGANTLWH